MHCNLLAKSFVATVHGNQNADLAHAGHDGVVDVGHNGFTFDLGHPAQGHVFADDSDLVGDDGRDGLAAHIGFCKRLNAVNRDGNRCDACNHFLEVSILANEVGFRVHLDSHTGGTIDVNGHEALSGGAPGLLGSLCKALGAQPVNSGFHVAVCFCQRFFSVHHACAGGVAQFLNLSGRDCHLLHSWNSSKGSTQAVACAFYGWEWVRGTKAPLPDHLGYQLSAGASASASGAISSSRPASISPRSMPAAPIWADMPSRAARATRSQ